MLQSVAEMVRRNHLRLVADPSRVVTQLFVPGQEGFDHQESRSSAVLKRLLALDDDEVTQAVDDVLTRFEGRHRDLLGTFHQHADELADRLDPDFVLSPTLRVLIGATFTNEYAVEGAALCNPSMVADPDQSDASPGCLKFIMSVRGIGEGHRSSIGFRTGTIQPDGDVSIDPTVPFVTRGQVARSPLDVDVFRGELHRLHGVGEDADYILAPLGHRFSRSELEGRIVRLEAQLATRRQGSRVAALIRDIADRTYSVRFGEDTVIGERVLLPAMNAESNGMEDARFVRFEDGKEATSFLATYTAYNGSDIRQQLVETEDFLTFTSTPIVGPAAANKGLALFPRRINGRFVAISRSDRETNTITTSDSLRYWEKAVSCQVPTHPWEILQLGNCGSPIETEVGWLVLTHGVGPMRTYSIGAILLDLEDPTVIIGQLDEPLLSPEPDERNGYVPNVVYSCGSLIYEGTLVIPYGIGDSAIGVATVPMEGLLMRLLTPLSS